MRNGFSLIRTWVFIVAAGLLFRPGICTAQTAGDQPAEPPVGVTPLPILVQPNGVLFRLKAPTEKDIFVIGTFNAWGNRNGMDAQLNQDAKMYGPDENGVFEFFYPMTPGLHAYMFNLGGKQRIYGDPYLPKAKDVFKTSGDQGRYDLKGSLFQFQMQEPPWPSYVPNHLMMPVVVPHPKTGEPALRVRYYSRIAKSVHCVGGWDGWAGQAGTIDDEEHRLQPTKVRNISEFHIAPVQEGTMEYKFVVDTAIWLSDPTVLDTNPHGNSMVQLLNKDGQLKAFYTPRFDPYQKRAETAARWGNAIKWADNRDEGFARAKMERQRMFWVITMPGSDLSNKYMKTLNTDPEMVALLKDYVCLETPAHEVRDIINKQRIARVPFVILVNSQYKPEKMMFRPELAMLKQDLQSLK